MKLKDNKQKIINNIEKNGYYYSKRMTDGTITVSDIELYDMAQFSLRSGNINTLKNNYRYSKTFNLLFLDHA